MLMVLYYIFKIEVPMMRRYWIYCFLLGWFMITAFGTDSFPARAFSDNRPEVRALWVDAFRDGIKTPAQADQLIHDAVRSNINTLIVQVRRRGDAYFNHSIEPRTEDSALEPDFDALQYLIDRARPLGIEVHAWLNTLVAWNSTVPPRDPDHVWNLHGPKAVGRDNWVSYYRTYDKTKNEWSEQLYPSYYLDPGHPDVQDYTAAVYLNVIRNYQVDGIHLDYSRYAGKEWGFNPTSVELFNQRFGTSGMPSPEDPLWQQWRREQTANLVRKIYLKALAVRPDIKVSSAVITWGDGPVNDEDWEKSRAYVDVGQDWRSWLEAGMIDMVIPMNYFSEWNTTQQLWYNRWIEWEKNHQYGRQIVIGPGIFMQYIEDSLEQIRRAQSPSALGNRAAGVALFSYGAAHLYSTDDFKASKTLPRQPHQYLPESNGWFYDVLAKEGGYVDPVWKTFVPTQPVFPTPVPVPEMPWKTRPVTGYLMGAAVDRDGRPEILRRVVVERLSETDDGPFSGEPSDVRGVFTDGSGWFGLTELVPGRYRVTLEGKTVAYIGEVDVMPGRVAEIYFPE